LKRDFQVRALFSTSAKDAFPPPVARFGCLNAPLTIRQPVDLPHFCSCQHRWQNNARFLREHVQKLARFLLDFRADLSPLSSRRFQANPLPHNIFQSFLGVFSDVQKVTPPYRQLIQRRIANAWRHRCLRHAGDVALDIIGVGDRAQPLVELRAARARRRQAMRNRRQPAG